MMLAPLASSLLACLLPRTSGQFVSALLILLSAAFASILFFTYETPVSVDLFSWVGISGLSMNFGLYMDRLSATMCMLITTVSSAIHFYSIGYMKGEEGVRRFTSCLSFFTFAMLVLVTSSDLVQMFIGWEGVGLASYLLIGFWFQKDSANLAAQKAFLVNRVGDFCLLLGICLMIGTFSTSDVQEVIGTSFGANSDLINLICLLLVVGAASKSAQVFLHVWLPDAMEGPTPVSALIHSATMVTAGVFLLCRLSPILEMSNLALQVVTLLGAATAFYASTVALAQNDIKRIIAYSTCSQIGFMFIAVGISAYPAAIFHLFTHGFFKALLFLCAGIVIIAMHHEQDIRKMGGLAKKMPLTCILTWIGSLSLMGVPFFSGYYSKDMIIEAAFAADSFVGYLSFVFAGVASIFTAMYSLRLLWFVFHKKTKPHDLEETTWTVKLPAVALSFGAVFVGFIFAPYMIGSGWEGFWSPGIEVHHSRAMKGAELVPMWVVLTPLLAVLAAIALVFLWNRRAGMMMPPPLGDFLFHAWYFDRVYHNSFVKGGWSISALLKEFGESKIDKFVVDGVARFAYSVWNYLKVAQDGVINHYALALVASSIATLFLFLYL